ncbi:MAG: NUDIX domain-containing protein, partial [Actinomycetota bacterium]
IGEIAESLAAFGSPEVANLAAVFQSETGYATPKLIVRAAVIDQDRILMVKETADGRWTLPGGWVDIGESPSVAAEREVAEESGYRVRAVKLAALYDKLRHQHPRAPHHAYLVFVLCQLLGGEARRSVETSEIGWFSVDQLPPLSPGRATEGQIRRMFDHHRHPHLPADFD